MRQAQRARPGWWPFLRYTHPNYFIVLVGELLIHVGLTFAAFWGAHPSASWYYIADYGRWGFYTMGAAHAVIAVMMIAGFYWNWAHMRCALLVSVTVYILQTSLLTAGLIRSYLTPGVQLVSIEGTFYGLGLILLSAAAFREPVIPGRYGHPDSV